MTEDETIIEEETTPEETTPEETTPEETTPEETTSSEETTLEETDTGTEGETEGESTTTEDETNEEEETEGESTSSGSTSSSSSSGVYWAEPQTEVFEVMVIDEPVSGSNTMSDVVRGVLGEYERQTYTVQHIDSSGNIVATSTEYVSGLAGLDYAWIAGAIFFGIVLVGIFKLLGGLIRR